MTVKQPHTTSGAFEKSKARWQRLQTGCWSIGVGGTTSSSSSLGFSRRFLRRMTATVVVTAFLNFLRVRNEGLGGTRNGPKPSVLRRDGSARLVLFTEKAKARRMRS